MSARLPAWVTGRPLLGALVAAHVVLKLALLPRVLDAPLQGDEVAYADSAGALSNLVRDLVALGGVNRQEIADNVVGNGWFMPGMSTLLTPVYLVDPQPSVAVVRVYLGALTLVLSAATAWSVDRHLGRVWTLAFLVVPGLLPMWVLYSYSAWGDLCAGLVVVVLLCRVVAAGRELRDGRAPTPRAYAALGALCAAALYLRSSTLPLVGGLLVLVILGSAVLALPGTRRRAVLGAVGAGVVFAALLAPWSVAASATLDSRVVTTTTVPISLGVTFGDTERLCFGPCGTDHNIWYATVAYSMEVSDRTGVSEVAVQRQMADYALHDVTGQGLATAVRGNFDRYATQPSGFEPVFREVPGSPPDAVSHVITRVTDVGYAVVLIAAAAAFLVVPRRRVEPLMAGLVLKLAALAMFTQPFLHIGSPRYWPLFVPTLTLLAVWAGSLVGGSSRHRGTRLATWLTVLHVVVGATLAAVVAGVLVLSSR